MLELQQKFQELVNKVGNATVRTGTILPYGGELISKAEVEANPNIQIPDHQQILEHQGWFLCDGRQLNRGEYEDLYHIISANFGALDEEHFNLPDLRGRFVRGVDYDAGMDPDKDSRKVPDGSYNKSNGVGLEQDDEFRKHKHQWQGWRKCDSGSAKQTRDRNWDASDPLEDCTNQVGGNETRPKNIYLNWIIYAGVKKANI